MMIFRLALFLSCFIAALAVFPEDIAKEENEAWQDLEKRVELGVAADGDAFIWEKMDRNIDVITQKLDSWKAGDKANPEGITNIVHGTNGTSGWPLNGTCLNLNCDYFYYYLTCKAFGVNMDHICASYFVGWIFHCSDYPYYEDISDAPSVCLTQFVEDGLKVVENAAANFSNISGIHNYSEACERNCYQNYVRTGSRFINECYDEIENAPNRTKKLTQLYAFNAFYGLSCTESQYGVDLVAAGNCYDQLQTNQIVPVPGYIPPTENFNCSEASITDLYCPDIFEPAGCCFANQYIMLEQTPAGSDPLNITILPPCVQRLNYLNCPQASYSDLCTYGMNQNTTLFSGFLEFKAKPNGGGQADLPAEFPNVYDHVAVVDLQGVISTALGFNSAVPSSQIMLPTINVQITNYSYYGTGGTPLTPVDGVSRDQSDFAGAKSAKYWFTVVIVYSTESQAEINNAFLGTDLFNTIVGIAYSLPKINIESASTSSTPFFYEAEPFDTTHSAAATAAPMSVLVNMGSMIMCLLIMSLW